MPERCRRASLGRASLAAGLIVALLAVAGCGASGTHSAAATAAPGSTGATTAARSPGPTTPGNSAGATAAASPFTPSSSGGPSASAGAGASTAPSGASSGSAGGSAAGVGTGAGTSLAALQGEFVNVIRRVNPSVVLIETSTGLGSGVVFDSRGDIVTNAHVTAGATSFTVTLADGRSLKATLVGQFVPNDIAVVRVSASGLHPATFAGSSSLQVGDIVLAMGNPLGLQSSVTEGIVSAVGRTVSEPTGAALPDVIQTSAAINPGNSGGALVNLNGDVVGIPTLAASDPQLGGAAAGIGFAIPSRIVRDLASQIIQYGHVVNSHRAYIGIEAADLSSGTPTGGVLIYSVVSGGPASKAGLQAGDVITSVAGQPTPSAGQLAAVLAGLKPGQTVPVRIMLQNGTQRTVNVTLGQLPG
ncbi:MAG: trypsin-like peptidase domain-containing protein [Chloroflexi bacterium]|nr:trypsin-like peptidase domain-containing protein [Chloroflexota bacterium]